MDKKKRYHNTLIWQEAFYSDLDNTQRLMWKHANDRCDNIGVYELNHRQISYDLYVDLKDMEVFLAEFYRKINRRGKKIVWIEEIIDADKKDQYPERSTWLLTDFVRFQYCGSGKPLRNKAVTNTKGREIKPPASHLSYLALMEERGLTEYFCKHQPLIMPAEMVEQYGDLFVESDR